MSERVLERGQFFPESVERVFAPFADAGNLQAITPPWLHFRIISELPIEMKAGAIIEYRLRFHGVPVRWRTVIESWDPPHRFTDVQQRGPFALWHHTHTFEPVEGGTLARDRVRYRVGFGPFDDGAHALFIGRDLARIFDFRRTAVLDLVTVSPDGDSQASGNRFPPDARAIEEPSASGQPGDRRHKGTAIAFWIALSAMLIVVGLFIRQARSGSGRGRGTPLYHWPRR